MRQSREWYSLRNSGATTAELYIYDEIGYWGTTASDLVAALSELRGVTAIDVHVNSPGGDVFDGIAIMNCLRACAATVTVYVDGIAASIASVIAMAGDRIIMGPHSQLMIHDASGLCLGNAEDMTEMATMLNFQSDNIAAVYAERTGGTVEDWRAKMSVESWYTAEEAVAAGLADEVAQRPAPAAPGVPMDKAWDLTMFAYAGREKAPAPVVAKAPPETVEVKPAVGEHVLTPADVKAAAPSEQAKPALTINIAEALDAETVEALRAAVRDRGAAAAVAEFGISFTSEGVPIEPVGTGPDGTAAGQEPPPAPESAAPTEPEAAEALLVVPGEDIATPETEPAPVIEPELEEEPERPDSWAAAVARLTTPPAEPTVGDLLAALREASL
jgi:ATP-dependent protease ClpP protease subunit